MAYRDWKQNPNLYTVVGRLYDSEYARRPQNAQPWGRSWAPLNEIVAAGANAGNRFGLPDGLLPAPDNRPSRNDAFYIKIGLIRNDDLSSDSVLKKTSSPWPPETDQPRRPGGGTEYIILGIPELTVRAPEDYVYAEFLGRIGR